MPIQGRADDEVALRAEFFKHVLGLMDKAAARRGRTLFYHVGQPELLAHVYFALHDAFKSFYLRDGHLSDSAKRAAVSCATVIAVAPIHPNPNLTVDPNTDDDIDYPNPFLAARCAATYLSHPFEKKSWDARRRDYVGYTGLQFACVDPIIADWEANNGRVTQAWLVPKLSPQEEASLCLLANSFQTAALFQVPQQSDR
ncbi:hypothetical protein JQ614_32205 [Bradyrhizobium diazoefficiens]|uniref:hypothetical protein n=1 Tax=Bradyrhizobium diazoefficiens TaxID=1355477 RepID=UPI001B8D143D|nr:hypothetical protein [Bradyrhizobium diazoefficiens]MBR0866293.1 hypothetical protein [Bradyrhizobium diazoefficiens]MBR0890754.1 hypothetical protein [Bradyrhizobium diazoefficiens]MBR0922587.1 hypothetical protein [Bradyrhizobium diazoefficiens]